jgi:radical SAM/Cys-rich protein
LTNAATTTESFASSVRQHGAELRSGSIESVQVNIGAACNLACRHCHVESSPSRRERMDWQTMHQVLDAAEHLGARQLDITGGAPELHPDFRAFVSAARDRQLNVIVRTNLTVLLRTEMRDLPEFFRHHTVRLVASLPCYLGENVDRQRGRGVFDDSIKALRRLNDLGYGREAALELDLVYNPLGASLPPSQEALELAYRAKLREQHGIEFTRLYALANMPIGRFAQDLARQGQLDGYLNRLRASFNPGTLPGLMCRSQIHVGWDGRLYDCDFNFVLGMPVETAVARHVSELLNAPTTPRRITTGEHCFGCTAGQGSSCGGALA